LVEIFLNYLIIFTYFAIFLIFLRAYEILTSIKCLKDKTYINESCEILVMSVQTLIERQERYFDVELVVNITNRCIKNSFGVHGPATTNFLKVRLKVNKKNCLFFSAPTHLLIISH